jgi:hypothetical protein
MRNINEIILHGVISGMSAEDYHANKAIGSTTIKSISKSPANFYFNKFTGSKSAHIGSAVHCKLLEPDVFDREYLIMPDIHTRSSRQFKELAESYDEDKILIKGEGHIVKKMCDFAMLNNEFVYYMMSPGESELSMFATCPRTGLQLKCRFDRYSDQHQYPLDIKTCRDISPRGFSQAFLQYGYHIQAAFYLYVLELATGRKLNQFCFFAIENSAPYRNCMYFIDEDSLELGRAEMFKALDLLVLCQEHEELKYSGIVLPNDSIGLPSYVFDDEFNDEVAFS